MVTSDTSSSGLTGHAAIVVSGTEYVEIKGAGYHPQKGLLTTWFSNHPKKIRIMGHNNFTESKNAGNWALNFFNNYSTVTYDIDDLYQYNKTTYCSKIVWDVYHFGAGIDLDSASFNIGNVFVPYWITIVTPYSLLHTTHNNYLKYANDSNW